MKYMTNYNLTNHNLTNNSLTYFFANVNIIFIICLKQPEAAVNWDSASGTIDMTVKA